MADIGDTPTSENAAVEVSKESAEKSLQNAQAAISLDDLVNDTAGAAELALGLGRPDSTAGIGEESSAGGASGVGDALANSAVGANEKSHSVAGAPVPGAPLDSASLKDSSIAIPDPLKVIEQVDRVLTIEDPTFVASLEELKDIGKDAPPEVAILPEDPASGAESDEVEPHTWASVMKARKNGFRPFLLEFISWFKYHSKSVLAAAFGVLKAVLGSFMSLRALAKVMVLGVIALTIALSLVLKLGFLGKSGGRLGLPIIEASFLGEFATVADHSYEYEDESQMVNFLDPMLHPENVVLVDHIVVNLKTSSAHENPMALIDFYIEAGSKDAAIEVKQRDVEVRDSMSRVIEQISYEDITTDAGKYKLKVILRKNLNDFMTTGRVRRIYFKTFVLKP